MPTSRQSIREIVSTQPSEARILRRFDINLCSQADESLDQACAELQLSVDQALERLADAETDERGAVPANPATLSTGRLIQHIVRVHHRCVRQKLAKADAWTPLFYSTASTPSERRYGRTMIITHVKNSVPPSTRGCGPQ
jgi:iron-sulfur cluster repair protein YtfE (RIC family)